MAKIIEEIEKLYASKFDAAPERIEKLPQSGSDRFYFRVYGSGGSCIATVNDNIKENRTFIYFSKVFKDCNAPVPEVYNVNDDENIYLQHDLGDESLLARLEALGSSAEVFDLYRKSLRSLASLQVCADEKLDYSKCITSKEFGRQAILNDLLYFKYYFLDTLKIPYDKEQLINDFESLSDYLDKGDKYFMFRDFQSRNIMVKDDDIYFIDYQGGMKGALQYDVASLLWQAKANLSDEWKDELMNYYIDCIDELMPVKVERNEFVSQYNGYVLIRLLQVLGAYGFRGLFERKSHFLTSIPQALRNLSWFLDHKSFGIDLPNFKALLKLVVDDAVINKFETRKANSSTPLTVKINSFSYIQRGYPPDPSKNGGGFVFDCRGILNPGRIEVYKTQTGRDKDVKDYIEQQTRMGEFLQNIFNVVDITVEDYIERGFESLMINFGCTGGRHRSVYAADALARHLRNKYGVKIEIGHLEQNIFEVKECKYP